MKTNLRGAELLRQPVLSKSTVFTDKERDALGLTGLLPASVESEDLQIRRVMQQLGHKNTDLDRYVYLMNLLDHDETLFLQGPDGRPCTLPADRLRPHRRRGVHEDDLRQGLNRPKDGCGLASAPYVFVLMGVEVAVFDVVVIGAGPAGLVAALRAGDLGARTALVTQGAFGGMAAG